MRKMRPGALVAGLSLLLVGGWLVAGALVPQMGGGRLIGLDRLWPALPFLIGLTLAAQFMSEPRKRDGLIFLAVIAMLSGSFLCLFSLQIGRLDWPDMISYWPVFPIIIGGAFLLIYLTSGMRDQSLLRPAYLFGGIGIFALPFTLGVIRGAIFTQAARLWPVLAVVLLVLVVLSVRSRTRQNQDEQPQ